MAKATAHKLSHLKKKYGVSTKQEVIDALRAAGATDISYSGKEERFYYHI